MNPRPARNALLLFAIFSVIGLLFFSSYYFDDLARMNTGTALRRFIEEMSGAYTALALFPAIVWLVRRFPPARTRPESLVIAVAAALVYSAAHTTMMALSRSIIFPLSGLGAYDYGIMLYRYPMEAAKDVMSFTVAYGCVYFLGRLERGRRAELAAAELQTKLAEAQFENLRLQLHPHFLFNTLNAISSVMYEDVRRADEMISKLSDFLRIVLASGGVVHVDIAQELHIEEMYVDIMTSRLERRLELCMHVTSDARESSIPFMLLQPLLENSIRHGMTPERGGLRIGIDVRREGNLTVVDVSDDGVGFDARCPPGHGLKNVESRLQHLYGSRSSFSIAPGPAGGTHVRLAFPRAIPVPA